MAQISPFLSAAILHKMRVYYTALTGLQGVTTDTPGVANTNFSNQHCVIMENLSGSGAANILVNVNASDFMPLPIDEHVTMLFGAFGQAVGHQIFTSADGFRIGLLTVPNESQGTFAQILTLLDEGYAQSHMDEAIGGALLSAEYQYANYVYTYGLSLTDYAEDKNQFYEALRQFGLEGRLNSDFSNPQMQRFFIEKAPIISDAMYMQNQAQRAKTAADLANELRVRFNIAEPLMADPTSAPGAEKTGSTRNKGVTVTNRQEVLDQLEEAKKAMEEGLIDPESMKPDFENPGSQLISHDKEVNEKMKELGMATSEAPVGAENSGVTIMEDDRQDDYGLDEELDELSEDADLDSETSEIMPEGDNFEIVDSDGNPIETGNSEKSDEGKSGSEGTSKDGAEEMAEGEISESEETGKAGKNGEETEAEEDLPASATTGSASDLENDGNDAEAVDSEGNASASTNSDKGTNQEGLDNKNSSMAQAGNNQDNDMSGKDVDLTGSGTNDMPIPTMDDGTPSLSGIADELKLSSYDVNDEMLSLTEGLISEVSEDARQAAEEAAMEAKTAASAKDNFIGLECTDLHGLSKEYAPWLSNGEDPVHNNIVLDYIKNKPGIQTLSPNSYDPSLNPEEMRNALSSTHISSSNLSLQYDAIVAKLAPQINYLSTSLEKMLIKERNAHNYGKKGKLSIKKQINKPQSLRPFIKHNNTDNAYNTCVTCIVDLSGSMRGYKSYQAMLGAIILSETCAKLGVPCKISGFHSPETNTPDHEHFTSWANSRPERETLMAIPALTRGNNFDAFAITILAEDALKKAPADHNLIFVLSDGLPNTRDYDSKSEDVYAPDGTVCDYINGSETEVRRIVRSLKRKARVYGIGIEHDVHHIYENTTINIKDASQIGVTLGSYLQVALRDFVREDLS